MSTASVSKAERSQEPRQRPLRLRVHTALRWLHTYLSLLSLLAVLFFSATGLTLNHPEWTFGFHETRRDVRGTLPAGWQMPTGGGTDWLKVADYLRATYRVHGTVADRRDEEKEGSISFKAPGYAADCFFDRRTGVFRLTTEGSGPLAVLNDLHRGRDAGPAWAMILDLSAVFLIVIALTGIGLLFYLKRTRGPGLATMAFGCLLLIWLMRLTAG